MFEKWRERRSIAIEARKEKAKKKANKKEQAQITLQNNNKSTSTKKKVRFSNNINVEPTNVNTPTKPVIKNLGLSRTPAFKQKNTNLPNIRMLQTEIQTKLENAAKSNPRTRVLLNIMTREREKQAREKNST